jgi:hypothetical protein
MWIAWTKIILFVAIISGPVMALGALGYVEPYGRAHSAFPTFAEVVGLQADKRDAFGDALLQRSYITRAAIELKGWFEGTQLQFVDTPQVVSGRGGWLFLKDEFWRDFCLKENETRQMLARVDVMTDLAAASGFRMFFSISPDKSVIYPEQLHPLARPYWYCKASSSALLRRLIKSEAPRVIDHAEALLLEKARRPHIDLFFKTDTHWTPYGAAIAMRQMLSAVFSQNPAKLPLPRLSGTRASARTDLRNKMLLRTELESYEEIDGFVEVALPLGGPAGGMPKVVVLADSFYDRFGRFLMKLIKGSEMYYFEEKDIYPAAIAKTETLVVNTIERAFPHRALTKGLTWDSPLGQALLSRNSQAAESCGDYQHYPAESPVLGLFNIASHNDGWHATGLDPQIVVPIPARDDNQHTCLRIVVDVRAVSMLELFLPHSRPVGYPFSAGRSILRGLVPGHQTIAFVLPDAALERSIRIDPGSGPADVIVKSIAIGTRPAFANADHSAVKH